MERLWGAPVPPDDRPPLRTDDGRRPTTGKLKALVVMNDNPLMLAPGRSRVRKMLESLDFLAVIDSLPTDTANLAHVVLADVSPWAKEGHHHQR